MPLKRTLLAILITGLVTADSAALEPKPDRAQVQNIYATLLLPDGSYLNTDINFDCGSQFKDTGLIVTTEQGAKFLARAYQALYGDEAAKAVIDAWTKKANLADPRKPTMLLVNKFNDSKWPEIGLHERFNNKLNRIALSDVQSVNSLEQEKENVRAPIVLQLCGARVHETQ
ncbi:hypothetical protein [Pseudoalteromonas rubra]|uniref:hypothetical protein n=1 Tax=Pseudoalteromonas rubra TaxID=43658 RepID=UPI002DBE7995|nr:hypothetical protein [Pseudoalteromonas rubra]MEC4091871.1 hypothetical protein [Pseudoalteromonas rubra]